MITFDYFRIYWKLILRDLIVIKKRYKGALIDAGIPLIVEVIVFGYLFPLMGVPHTFIGPLFLGAQTMSMFFIVGSFGFRNIFDIQYTR